MTQQPDRSTSALLGTLPLLRGGLAVEFAPCAGDAQGGPPRPGRQDLDASGERTRGPHFAAVTIERWYYTAQREKDDPVGVLRRAVRKDCGKVTLAPALAERLRKQYHDHPHWSYQLHYDNLAASVKADPALGPLRSYCTVRRYMQAHGMVRKPRPAPNGRPGEARADEAARDTRDPQLRSRVRRFPVASRFPPRLAQGAHLRAASGSARWPWASSTTTRDCAATSSGISRRRPRTSCMASPRRSRNAACPGRF